MEAIIPDPNHLKIVYWYIRNAGAKGFGPFADLEPRKVIHVPPKIDGKGQPWTFLPGFGENDIELMPEKMQ